MQAEHVSPFRYWSDNQVQQAFDLQAHPRIKIDASLSIPLFGLGPTIGVSSGSAGEAGSGPTRTEQVRSLETLLDRVTAENTDVRCTARYCRGTAYAYWGVLRLPHGKPSYAAMFAMETDSATERTMLALFGPRRNLVDRAEGNDIDPRDVNGWSSSSETGQQLLLGIAGFDPLELELREGQSATVAEAAVKILKGQGIIRKGMRSDSGLIARCRVSFLARIYFWQEDVWFNNLDRYDRVGVGAPVWVRAEGDTEYLKGKTHTAGVLSPENRRGGRSLSRAWQKIFKNGGEDA